MGLWSEGNLQKLPDRVNKKKMRALRVNSTSTSALFAIDWARQNLNKLFRRQRSGTKNSGFKDRVDARYGEPLCRSYMPILHFSWSLFSLARWMHDSNLPLVPSSTPNPLQCPRWCEWNHQTPAQSQSWQNWRKSFRFLSQHVWRVETSANHPATWTPKQSGDCLWRRSETESNNKVSQNPFILWSGLSDF